MVTETRQQAANSTDTSNNYQNCVLVFPRGSNETVTFRILLTSCGEVVSQSGALPIHVVCWHCHLFSSCTGCCRRSDNRVLGTPHIMACISEISRNHSTVSITLGWMMALIPPVGLRVNEKGRVPNKEGRCLFMCMLSTSSTKLSQARSQQSGSRQIAAWH